MHIKKVKIQFPAYSNLLRGKLPMISSYIGFPMTHVGGNARVVAQPDKDQWIVADYLDIVLRPETGQNGVHVGGAHVDTGRIRRVRLSSDVIQYGVQSGAHGPKIETGQIIVIEKPAPVSGLAIHGVDAGFGIKAAQVVIHVIRGAPGCLHHRPVADQAPEYARLLRSGQLRR